MSETQQPGPLEVRLSDQLGLVVNRALFDPACQRLAEWALIGPVQRAALESFAERLLAAERERCATLIEPKNPPSDWTPLAQYAADLARMVRTESRPPETQPGVPTFDGADAWNAHGA